MQKCDSLISKISKYQPQMDQAKNFQDADVLDFPILGLLEKEYQDDLVDNFKPVTFEKNTVIYEQNEKAKYIYFIKTGLAKEFLKIGYNEEN